MWIERAPPAGAWAVRPNLRDVFFFSSMLQRFDSVVIQGNAVVYCLSIGNKNTIRAAHIETGQTIWEATRGEWSPIFCVTTDGRVCLHNPQKKTLEIFKA